MKNSKQQLPEQTTKPLSPQALDARRRYYREYNRKNRDKRRQWNANHWERIAQAEERQED